MSTEHLVIRKPIFMMQAVMSPTSTIPERFIITEPCNGTADNSQILQDTAIQSTSNTMTKAFGHKNYKEPVVVL